MKKKIILLLISTIVLSSYSQDQRKALVDSLLKGVEIKKDIQYNVTGKPLHLDIYYPQKTIEKQLPCVVWIHGGGLTDTTIKKDYDLIRWGIARTTPKGYISVSIDYTLITESPLPKAIQDCETAIRFIKSHAAEYKIDTTRIAVVGESSGGYLAGFCSFACDSDIFTTKEWNQVTNKIACGVLWYPTIHQSPNYNVIDFISAGDIPVISIHGEVDHIVPIDRSYQIQKKCEEKGVSFKLNIIKGADHGFYDKEWKFNEANQKNMEQAINITIDFLNNQLKLKSQD